MPRKPAAPKKPPVSWPADRIVRLKVADLLPYARNARMHTNAQVDQLSDAIKRFGFTNPVIVDARGEIIAGHGRVMAARRLDLEEVPGVRIADDEWSESDRRAYRIWDNQSALLSAWEPGMLKTELERLKVGGYDLAVTGFDPKALINFMANPNPTPPAEFQTFGESIATEHSCPRCQYRWSGNPNAAPPPAEEVAPKTRQRKK